jgi:hypothetical protein
MWFDGDYPENLEPDDERDVYLKKLCKALHAFSNELPNINDSIDIAFDDIMQIVDEIESFYESDDPRDMGWIGGDGLP